MISSGAEAADRKQRIRDRYKGVDTSELEVIPAKTVEGLGESTSIRRVAAYVRVSTDNDEQTSSYELQKNYYTDYIKAQPGWEFVGIYDDEGISGTSLEHRKGMQQLIEDCKAGKIDLILTKSMSRKWLRWKKLSCHPRNRMKREKPSSRRSISSRQNGQVLLENRSQVLHRLAFCSWNIMQETGMCSGRQQR